MLIFEKWCGRLGNNIIQLSNVIDIALFYKHNICFKTTHEFFNVKIIENYFNKFKNDEIIKDTDYFYNLNKLSIPNKVFNNDNKIKMDLLKKAFIIKDVPKLDENYVVIHIRSGDLFYRYPHPDYAPLPLVYYVNI